LDGIKGTIEKHILEPKNKFIMDNTQSLRPIIICNGVECYTSDQLISFFGLKDIDEFISKCIEPTKQKITRCSQAYENHIIEFRTLSDGKYYFYVSAYAVRLMAKNLYSETNDRKYLDICALFEDATLDIHSFNRYNMVGRQIRIGDRVTIKASVPDVMPSTAPAIDYKGREGVVNRIVDGNVYVIVDTYLQELGFNRSSVAISATKQKH
jgi:hypothetical protein